MVNRLADAAAAALECLAVGAEDDVLVVFNEEQRAVADSLATAAEARARSARALAYPALTRDGEEPPGFVAEAMLGATAIFAPTVCSLSHTRARIDATGRGARIATLPGLREETFVRALRVDYAELARAGERIAAHLNAASTCWITSPAGTDVVLSLAGRTAIVDDGRLQAAGAFGNLPAGESFIAPVEGVGDGRVVFDGSVAGYGLLREPVEVTLVRGRATAAAGEAGPWLLATLDAGGPAGRLVAELGIGTNPAATLSGSILEDEKVVGTAHVAFGANTSFGGTNDCSVHIDGLLLRPTIELDGEALLRDGKPVAPTS